MHSPLRASSHTTVLGARKPYFIKVVICTSMGLSFLLFLALLLPSRWHALSAMPPPWYKNTLPWYDLQPLGPWCAARYHLDACATPIASFAFPCSQSSRNAFSDRSRRCRRCRHPHLTRLRLSLPAILPSRNLLRSRFAFYSPGGSIPSQQRASLRRSPRTANTS